MAAVEERLFRGVEPLPVAGRIVTPAEARGRLDDGDYDWVVALPSHGPIVGWKSEAREIWGSVDAPRMTALELEDETVGVAWLAADALVVRGAELAPLTVAVDRVESLALGLIRGPAVETPSAAGPRMEIPDLSGPSPLRVLGTMPQQRKYLLESAWAAGLESRDAPELARGLALHFGSQQLSSPYDSRAMQIEIEEEPLRAFLAAAPPAGALDPVSRELWEALAWVFTEKRLPEETLVYLEPIAERFAPWPALDRALGRAYRELLEPETALRFLERGRRERPEDVELLLELAACAQELGNGQAIGLLEEARALQPGRKDVERALGLALVRSGDPRGRPLLERLLPESPDDPELLEALGLAPTGDTEPH
jgi:tetratricopeptide (TPR) repeat protein